MPICDRSPAGPGAMPFQTRTDVAARTMSGPPGPIKSPVACFALSAVIVAAVYGIPQGLHFLHLHRPGILLEENPEETLYAVLVSRAAGEHAAQPDPYRLQSREASRASVLSVQTLPPAALGAVARITGTTACSVFWAGSFVFPAILALLFAAMAWLAGMRSPVLIVLSATLSLLVLPPPYWLILSRQIAKILSGQAADFRMMLPYSRRFQPQFTAIIHYAAIASSLLILRLRQRRACLGAAVASGVLFGMSFYAYFFSWSLLAGWFALGAAPVWMWHRGRFRLWLLAIGVGIGIAAPYLTFIARHFHSVGASVGSARFYAIPQALVSDLWVVLAAAALLLFALRAEVKNRDLLWVPLALNLSAALAVSQNVITGLYIQPFHYIHYFARPAVSFALAALIAAMAGRISISPPPARALRAATWAVIGLIVAASAVIQLHHYRVARQNMSAVFRAFPAITFLRGHAAAGAVVYSPDQEVQEAIPLYTNAVPYFSVHMWLWTNDTLQNRGALLRRIAAVHVLRGMSRDEFVRLVRSRPWPLFFHYLQRPDGAQTEIQIHQIEKTLLEQFTLLAGSRDANAFGDLNYLLLPASIHLDSTKVPEFFLCRSAWHDSSYTVFALKPRP